jgi:hypothetical protein
LQYFQNLTLGNELFQEITGLDWILETKPYLEKYDSPMLFDETWREKWLWRSICKTFSCSHDDGDSIFKWCRYYRYAKVIL